MNPVTPSQASPKAGLPDNKAYTPVRQKQRQLPWQVEAALSRLRHDLQTLPMYRLASPEEIQRIKLQVIADVIRPMRTPELLKDFLLGCDLVARDIGVLEESQVEPEIVRDLSKEMLVATAREIIKDLEELGRVQGETPEEPSSEAISRRLFILREIADRLFTLGSAIDHDLLESLFKHQVLSLDDLPPDARDAPETAHLTDTFLTRKGEYLVSLAQIASEEASQNLTRMVSRILPELLRRGEYQTVNGILEVLKEGRRRSPVLEELARLLSQAMANDDSLKHLIEDLDSKDKDRRNYLVEILAFVGDPAGPRLLGAYTKSEAKAVRMSAFEVIRRIGGSLLERFLMQLPDIEHDWFIIFHILEALGEQGDVSLAQPISRLLQHPNAHVRQAALTALFKLQGAAAESYFLQALRGDRESTVRQMAVAYLGRIRSRHPEALELYIRALHVDEPSVPLETDGVLIEICKALANSESLSADYISKAEKILLATLRPVEQKRFVSWVKKALPQRSEQVRIALCKALAALGTSASVGPLSEIAKSESGVVAESAASAAKQIQERSSQGLPPQPD